MPQGRVGTAKEIGTDAKRDARRTMEYYVVYYVHEWRGMIRWGVHKVVMVYTLLLQEFRNLFS